MKTAEFYLDTARLGRMCRGARLAEQDFGRLVGRSGSSLYLERFLAHGYRALPIWVARRVPHLKAWPGMRGFRTALGQFIAQPPELPTYFFAQSSALIRFAADCLFANSKRVLITDLAWPPYVDGLRQVAKERNAQLIEIRLRDLVRYEFAAQSDVLEHITQTFQRNACDGVFLSDITYDGIRLPVEELLTAFRTLQKWPFTIVDGAQAFHQRPVSLNALKCDLYLSGTQKWFGAYHPLRQAFVASGTNLGTIKAVANNLSQRSNADSLFRFIRSLELADFASFGETVNLSALIAAAGALSQANTHPRRRVLAWEAGQMRSRKIAAIGDVRSTVEGKKVGRHRAQRRSLGRLR